MSNRNPTVLVTGASRGLGRGAAVELAKAGFSVAIGYAGNKAAAEECRKLCAEAAAPGQRFEIFAADIGKKEDRSRLVEEVFAAFGDVDALVNNAGMSPRVRADILEASEESFEEIIRVNLQGPYFLTQAIAKRWLSEGKPSAIPTGRKIVFVTSISAFTASVNRGDYCMSKAGLSMSAKLWAARLAESGISVYELQPGVMATDMTSSPNVRAKYDAFIAQGGIPQGRWGEPQDVGKAVRALLAGDFPYSTGSIIILDGGLHLARL